MPTPHAEEVLSVHLQVPSPAPGGCVKALLFVCVLLVEYYTLSGEIHQSQ